jgi:hypothetical protein
MYAPAGSEVDCDKPLCWVFNHWMNNEHRNYRTGFWKVENQLLYSGERKFFFIEFHLVKTRGFNQDL